MSFIAGFQEIVDIVHYVNFGANVLVLAAKNLIKFKIVVGESQYGLVVGIKNSGQTSRVLPVDSHDVWHSMYKAAMGTGQENGQVAKRKLCFDKLFVNITFMDIRAHDDRCFCRAARLVHFQSSIVSVFEVCKIKFIGLV